MVVLFFAALSRNADPTRLRHLTGFRQECLDAVAHSMANGSWENDQYTGSYWLKEGFIDEDEFGNQVEVAMGSLGIQKKPAIAPSLTCCALIRATDPATFSRAGRRLRNCHGKGKKPPKNWGHVRNPNLPPPPTGKTAHLLTVSRAATLT
jgi:hypothetical protein